MLLLFAVDAGVVDGQRGHATDRLDGRDLVVGERALRARLEQLDQADHRIPGDERHRQAAPLAIAPHLPTLELVEALVAIAGDGDRRARLHGQRPGGPLVQREIAALPRQVDLVVAQAHRAGQLIRPGQAVDVAVGDVDGGTEALRRGEEHVFGLDAGDKGETGFVDQHGAPVVRGQVAVQGGVGYCPRGELGQALEQLQMGETAGDVVEQKDLADLLAVGDQRQSQTAAVAVLEPRLTLGLARAALRLDVEDFDGLLPEVLSCGEEELARGVQAAGEGLVDDVAIDADEAARAALLPGADVAGGRVGDGAQPAGDRDDHFVQVEAAAELQAGIDQGPQVGAVARRRAAERVVAEATGGSRQRRRAAVGEPAQDLRPSEPALASGRAPAGDLARVSPAAQRAGADAEERGRFGEAQPVATSGFFQTRFPHQSTYRRARQGT